MRISLFFLSFLNIGVLVFCGSGVAEVKDVFYASAKTFWFFVDHRGVSAINEIWVGVLILEIAIVMSSQLWLDVSPRFSVRLLVKFSINLFTFFAYFWFTPYIGHKLLFLFSPLQSQFMLLYLVLIIHSFSWLPWLKWTELRFVSLMTKLRNIF